MKHCSLAVTGYHLIGTRGYATPCVDPVTVDGSGCTQSGDSCSQADGTTLTCIAALGTHYLSGTNGVATACTAQALSACVHVTSDPPNPATDDQCAAGDTTVLACSAASEGASAGVQPGYHVSGTGGIATPCTPQLQPEDGSSACANPGYDCCADAPTLLRCDTAVATYYLGGSDGSLVMACGDPAAAGTCATLVEPGECLLGAGSC